jgi:hypothetical protein
MNGREARESSLLARALGWPKPSLGDGATKCMADPLVLGLAAETAAQLLKLIHKADMKVSAKERRA